VQWRQPGDALARQGLVDDGEGVQRPGETGVDRDVLGQREQLGAGDTVVQRGAGVGRQLVLGSAHDGQHRDRRDLPGGAGKLGVRERSAERALDHRVIHLRRAAPDLGQVLLGGRADQAAEFLLSRIVTVHCHVLYWSVPRRRPDNERRGGHLSKT
jgi:hypothetical protein